MKFRLMIGSAVVGFLAIATTALMLLVRVVNRPTIVSTNTPDPQTNKGHITVGTLEITDAFARPTAMEGNANTDPSTTKSKVSGVYLTITNTGDKSERLIKVESDIASLSELHETTITNDLAQMKPIEGGLEIPAGSTVKLATGGKHIMLTQLKSEIVLGHTISITLTFDSGAVITLDVPVLRA
jgi:copper(I)-binding protein